MEGIGSLLSRERPRGPTELGHRTCSLSMNGGVKNLCPCQTSLRTDAQVRVRNMPVHESQSTGVGRDRHSAFPRTPKGLALHATAGWSFRWGRWLKLATPVLVGRPAAR